MAKEGFATGGRRTGAGRKRIADEAKSYRACMAAIEKKFGSLEEGIEHVLGSDDEKIKLLIWQHVLGNPPTTSKVNLGNHKGEQLESGLINGGVLTVEVVRTVHNKDVVTNADKNNDSSRLPDVQQ